VRDIVGDPFANDPFTNNSSVDPFGGDPFGDAFKGSTTESSAFTIDLPPKVRWIALRALQLTG